MIRTARNFFAIFLIALLLAPHAVIWAVDSLSALDTAIRGLAPGTTIVLADGVYRTSQPIRIEGKRGTADAPIVVRAEHRGQAVIDGEAGFVIRDCEHLILEGFTLTNDADQPGVLLDNCRDAQVTRSSFRLQGRAQPRRVEHWVYVIGAHSGNNRIDHNLFEHKVNRGSFVFVRGDDAALACSQHDRIDHNYFRDVVYGGGPKGHEAIRTGGNDLGASGQSSFATIEYNLLEQCRGEEEVISLKSSDNIVRYNTLLNCRGAICLRLGSRDVVCGNFVLATDGAPGSGGVKLYGFDHRIFNNYFLGLTGERHEGPLALIPGTLDTPTTMEIGAEYKDLTTVPATRAWIAFNSWIDCAPLQFGFEKEDKDRTHLPSECTFINNLVVHTQPKSSPLVHLGLIGPLQAHDNLGYAPGTAPPDTWAGWFRWEDPRLHRADSGLWLLTNVSPVVDAALVEGAATVEQDVFGRARHGRLHVGAEEVSNEAIVRGPLTADTVGPAAP